MGASKSQHLQVFACAPDPIIEALEDTTAVIVKESLSAGQTLAGVDTQECTRNGSEIEVVQVVEIEVSCGESCSETAQEVLGSVDALAESIGESLNEAIDSGNFTEILQEQAEESGFELEDVSVDEPVEVAAGDVSIKTLAPSVSPSFSPTGSVSYYVIRTYAYYVSSLCLMLFPTPSFIH